MIWIHGEFSAKDFCLMVLICVSLWFCWAMLWALWTKGNVKRYFFPTQCTFMPLIPTKYSFISVQSLPTGHLVAACTRKNVGLEDWTWKKQCRKKSLSYRALCALSSKCTCRYPGVTLGKDCHVKQSLRWSEPIEKIKAWVKNMKSHVLRWCNMMQHGIKKECSILYKSGLNTKNTTSGLCIRMKC